ncbi:MAG: SH3 domain-containing protein [Clostridia bacterium]|nr:SH3 domain-containing protein [Clostridia bacterium]
MLNDGTPLRGNPDPNAYLQNILAQETVVFLFQSQVAADGMTWYLVQHSGQWGYIRADLVRPMGEQETADYLAQLEAELATPTPMPQVTPEPIGPDSTSAYAKLIKDKVNLRRTPSLSGTSVDRVPQNTLLLVLGSEYDGTYTWYQVNYDGREGYIRSDMAQMLTISELTDYYKQQMEASKPGASVTPNKNNNTDVVINGSPLQDLIPVDGSWTNNVVSGMPSYATATPDPNATPTPQPPAKLAALIRFSGDMTVNNVPALTQTASFSVYGKTKAYTTVTATVEVTVEIPAANAPQNFGLVASAIAENAQTVKKTVGQAVADKNGLFEMNVTLPGEGEYIVEFANSEGSFAQYGVTYDDGATPIPVPTATAQPLPTAMPVEEESGMGIWPFVIGGLLIAIAAAVYGVYVYRRRTEEEEDEEDEDEETEMRQAQLNMQRQRAASSAGQAAPSAPKAPTSAVIPGAQRAPRTPQSAQGDVPSYMRNAEAKTPVSPYARPTAPQAPIVPKAPEAPVVPKAPEAPVAPVAPKAPEAPVAPVAPKAPEAPVAPAAPKAPEAPVAPKAPVSDEPEQTVTATRRRRRPPVDPNA